MFGNMKALWLWFNYWNEHKNHYSSGDVARMVNGVFEADCCQIIKMFGWSRNDPSKVPTKQQSCPNYNKDGILDETISSWYTKATKKGTLATLPTTGYCLVYIDGGHVGIYNASTGETYEMCAGSVMGIRKQKINKNYWNKWSDLYWCPDYEEPKTQTSSPTAATNSADNMYHVQCGSFSVPAYAQRRYNELKNKGFDVCAKKAMVNGKIYYRIQVGAYSVKKNAENMLTKLKSAGYSDAYITTEGGTDCKL